MNPPPDDPGGAWRLGILLGGRSRRMGRDKAALPFGEGTLLQHVMRRCAPDEGEILLSVGDREVELPAGTRAVPDRIQGAGPLAGLQALRAVCDRPWLAVVPCDMPFIEAADLARLVEAARRGERAVARFGLDEEEVPLPVVLGRTTTRSLARALREGHNKLVGWEASSLCVPLDPGDPATEVKLLNVNDDGDLRHARTLAGYVDGTRGDC